MSALALILVQHLDPGHERLLVELLSAHTAMPVSRASDGMRVQAGHLYIIPPGNYLSVSGGALRLTRPEVPRHVWRPFEVLLTSLSAEHGASAACVILSGSGTDVSVGLAAIHAHGGLAIAQEPDEANYADTPDSAIATSLIDAILPVAWMAAVLEDQAAPAEQPGAPGASMLGNVVALLRSTTPFEFTAYKHSTPERRIERRLSLIKLAPRDAARDGAVLKDDAGGRDEKARDLLIHVTGFFRDHATFDLLYQSVVPDLVRDHPDGRRDHPDGRPLRMWVAGCSTGEETHSLSIVLAEAIHTVGRDIVLRIFAADIDPVAVVTARVVVDGGRTRDSGRDSDFAIDVQPLVSAGEQLLMVCFVERPAPVTVPDVVVAAGHDDLARELAATKVELLAAIGDLRAARNEQKAVDEEAVSINEEFQSTNAELLTSKEELQSLNEELTALNKQLRETLDRQRTTSDDLQNVLYSTDVATLFLDTDLKIRFFTPAIRALFSAIPGDVGRPLADLHSLASDETLSVEARRVLTDRMPCDREIQTPDGAWFRRRILPYLTHDGRVEGVVITFHDISRRIAAARALEAAKQQAEQANATKSRFLASASHDLRQPLQTLSLLQGLLAKAVHGEPAQSLVTRLDDALGAMAGMLDTLLDINQIEAGIVHAEPADFAIDDVLARLGCEFGLQAQAQGLVLRMVPCRLRVRSDPRLLEQMLRNLLGNALKYTQHGRVLLGCRRRRSALSVEIWDTGVGIPDAELAAVFQEYHQLDNSARERSRGLGLGLSIVQRLADLLGHRLGVRSRYGHGSVFSVEVPLAPASDARRGVRRSGAPAMCAGAILLCEDDPSVRALLAMALREDGYDVRAAANAAEALELVAHGFCPALILADFNLPGGMSGLKLVARLRERMGVSVPAIVLTGDISAATLRSVGDGGCEHLSKPIRLGDLAAAITRLLAATVRAATGADPSVIFVVDDDLGVLATLRAVLEDDGRVVETFEAGEAFLETRTHGPGCLLIDAYLPGMNGVEVLRRLRARGDVLPAIMITGDSDVGMAVAAMQAGASDFIEKPVSAPELLASLNRALEQSSGAAERFAWRNDAQRHMAGLTARQRQIMGMVLAGQPNKNIAADLGVSQRTVENHRAAIMRRTGAKSLPALARLAVAAET